MWIVKERNVVADYLLWPIKLCAMLFQTSLCHWYCQFSRLPASHIYYSWLGQGGTAPQIAEMLLGGNARDQDEDLEWISDLLLSRCNVAFCTIWCICMCPGYFCNTSAVIFIETIFTCSFNNSGLMWKKSYIWPQLNPASVSPFIIYVHRKASPFPQLVHPPILINLD